MDKLSQTLFSEIETFRNFFYHFQPFQIKHKNMEKKADAMNPPERKDVFFLHLTQSPRSHLKATAHWEGERCNFSSKLGFHTQFCSNILFCRTEEEITPQSLSVLSQLILLFLDHATVLVLSEMMTYRKATQGCQRSFSGAERQAACE